MPKILIDILPAQGHLNGSLKLALVLKNAGYDIVYLNMSAFQTELEKHGLEYATIEQYNRQFMIGEWKFSFELFFNKLFDFNRKELFKSEELEFQLFKKNIHEVSPDLVLLDDQNMLKAVHYKICNIPIVCLDNLPESCMSDNVPPYTSFFVPSNNFISKWFCKVLWFRKTIQNRWRLCKLQLNLVGTDYYSATLRITKQNKINLKKSIDLKRGFNIGIKKIPHIIVAPGAFDFPHPQKDGIFNVGPLVDINREGEIEKSRYNALKKNLDKYKEKESGFIIYCSLGTITQGWQSRKKRFLFEMMKVASQNLSDLFVLSAGKEFNINEFLPVPENMYVFEFVPQVDLLQFCDIMITHGGMNTITECVFCEVPMLVYPLSPHWDQPGNSARVVYHGLGLNGRITRDSAKTISKKLNIIKSDYEFYKKNVSEMKSKFDEKNNSNEVVDIIENILNEIKQE
jgi:zeaxanthin glucosyltransferase